MRILIIGGTRFVGRHLVDAALEHGHEVTLFNRGRSNPGLFPQLETIIGDREKDVNKLAGRIWDAVIDVAGYVPRIVRLSAEVLSGNVVCYVFISSISVYDNFRKIGMDESDPVGKLQDETTEEITEETYGPLKALCEQAVQDIYRERALIVRPGLVVGPHDPTDRFTYWPVGVARGGNVLAPEKPDAPIQIIDARDPDDIKLHKAWEFERVAAELARDDTPTEPVLEHALQAVVRGDRHPDAVVLLQCTSPLRGSDVIDACIERFEQTRADAVLDVGARSPGMTRRSARSHSRSPHPSRQDQRPLDRDDEKEGPAPPGMRKRRVPH